MELPETHTADRILWLVDSTIFIQSIPISNQTTFITLENEISKSHSHL